MAEAAPVEPSDSASRRAVRETTESSLDWRLLLFVLGTVIYLYSFYNVEVLKEFSSDGVRRGVMQWLMISQPFAYPEMWTGDGAGHAAVLDRLPVFAVATWIIVTGAATGWLVLDKLKLVTRLSGLEVFAFSTGIGLNVWSLLTLGIGLTGGLRQTWLFVTLMASMVLVAGWKLFEQRERVADQLRNGWRELGRLGDGANSPAWFARAGVGLLVPFFVFLLLGGALAPWHFDVREYHLQAPKEWYLQGRIGFMPHNIYGNMPLGAEMHALLGMTLWPGELAWWYGAIVGKVVIAAFAPLTALLVYSAGRRLLSPAAGLVAAIVYLSLPWIAHLSFTGLIEGVVAYYLFAAFYATLLWSRERHESRPTADEMPGDEARDAMVSSKSDRMVMVAGWMAGAAIACKYPSLLFVGFPIGLWVSFDRWAIHWRSALLYTVLLVAACGLWFGKNSVLAGNPTYPLLYSVFGGETMTPEKHSQWKTAHAVPRDTSYSEDSLLSQHSPSQLWNSVARVVYRNDWVSPLMMPLVVVGVSAVWGTRWAKLALVGIVYYFVTWWLFTHRLDRFWVPMLPLFALLCGASIMWLPTRTWGWTVASVCLFSLVYNFPFITSRAMGDNRFFVSLEELRTESSAGPGDMQRTHRAHRWLNRHAARDETVLLVGEAQPFDFEMSVLYATCFDTSPLERLLRDKTADERRRSLREYHVAYVFVNWHEIERYRSPGNYGFTDWITKDLVREELVRQQVLRPVPLDDLDPEMGQVFEVLR